MTTISSIALAAITGGNAAGNGQTGDRYRPNPNDDGSDPSTRRSGGLLGGAWGVPGGSSIGRVAGGQLPAANPGKFGRF
jgi:hypothetical protein